MNLLQHSQDLCKPKADQILARRGSWVQSPISSLNRFVIVSFWEMEGQFSLMVRQILSSERLYIQEYLVQHTLILGSLKGGITTLAT